MRSRDNQTMKIVLVVCLFVCVVVNSTPIPGANELATLHNTREAEPHDLEGVMNLKPDHNKHVVRDNFPQQSNSVGMHWNNNNMAETIESQINGERNKMHLEETEKRNAALPGPLRHKKLSEIWQKETPCSCSFTRWKPVCGVDGNTYPTACFAECVDVAIFANADCRYVRSQLWAKIAKPVLDGRIPTEPEELCSEGDDDGEDPRPKCKKQYKVGGKLTGPFDEENDDGSTSLQQQQQQTLPQQQASIQQQQQPQQQSEIVEQQEDEEEPEIQEGDIEWRLFHGVKVPYYTHEVPNPCPSCPLAFSPVCGSDNKTYPSKCFADCIGVSVAANGEC